MRTEFARSAVLGVGPKNRWPGRDQRDGRDGTERLCVARSSGFACPFRDTCGGILVRLDSRVGKRKWKLCRTWICACHGISMFCFLDSCLGSGSYRRGTCTTLGMAPASGAFRDTVSSVRRLGIWNALLRVMKQRWTGGPTRAERGADRVEARQLNAIRPHAFGRGGVG